tara:strand:+ start:841 stop:1128 length:288 start_codon:yes stop_codon:yes gene_type:complete
MSALILLLLFSFAEDETLSYVICKNGSIVRTIQVDWVESEKACITTYTKAGVGREVGRASNKPYCQKWIDNIRGNLTAAGWKCRDVSEQVKVISE